MKQYIEISLDEFENLFTLVKKPYSDGSEFNDKLFSIGGPEFDFVDQQPESKIWTVMSDDLHRSWLVSGYRFVNRLHYAITREDVPDHIQYAIPLF
jgi:hypothetical protein